MNKANEGITAEVTKVIELGIRNITYNPHKKPSMMV